MSKHLFDKLTHAIKQGKIREIGEAVKEIKSAAEGREPLGFVTVKLTAVYDSAHDCLEFFHAVDLGCTEQCLGIVARGVLAPDGDTMLYSSAELLDPHKHNKCASGCSVVHHLAEGCEGRSVAVHLCVLTVDAAGKVTLFTAHQHVAISASRPKL